MDSKIEEFKEEYPDFSSTTFRFETTGLDLFLVFGGCKPCEVFDVCPVIHATKQNILRQINEECEAKNVKSPLTKAEIEDAPPEVAIPEMFSILLGLQ